MCIRDSDNDHRFDAENGVSSEHVSKSIVIGKNCWIGANAVILKGSVIEDNCVIGAGCVIDKRIPRASKVTMNRELKIDPIQK